MKTLKQTLEDYSSLTPDIAIKRFREWLQEHVMEPEVRSPEMSDEMEMSFTAGQLALLRKLLEEL